MGDFVWVRLFPQVVEIFLSLTYNGVRFFSSIIRHARYIFQSNISACPSLFITITKFCIRANACT